MSSDIDRKRGFVDSLYPGPRWKKRVRKMSDAQVVAIYMREQAKARERAAKKPPDQIEESDSDDEIPF